MISASCEHSTLVIEFSGKIYETQFMLLICLCKKRDITVENLFYHRPMYKSLRSLCYLCNKIRIFFSIEI